MKKSVVGVRLDKETLDYITVLSDCLDLPKGYVVRRLLEFAIDMHKKGVIEFPELTVKPKELRKYLVEIEKEEGSG